MSTADQELVVLAIVAVAVLYLFKRTTGLPRFGRRAEEEEREVQLGARLQRGLAASKKSRRRGFGRLA